MNPPPKIRLAFPHFFWRAFLVVAVFMEVGLYHRLRPWLHMRGGSFRVAAMLLKSPRTLCRAFLWAALLTVLIDLYVRLVMRPLLDRRHAPRRSPDDLEAFGAFRLGAGETILEQIPARRGAGRRSEPGTLFRTEKALWFAPTRWDSEPWTVPLDQLGHATTRPVPRPFWGAIEGLPDRLAIPLADGSEENFVVADPAAALAWLP